MKSTYLIKEAKKLLVEGMVEDAINHLLLISDEFELKQQRNDLYVISSRYKNLKNHIITGTIDFEYSSIEQSRLISYLINIADKIGEELDDKEIKIKSNADLNPNIGNWLKNLFD
jgi:hypothetical protein